MPTLVLEPLTPEAFAPFGNVVANPATFKPAASHEVPQPVSANQGTAQKYSPITPIIDAYQRSSSRRPGEPRVSMFVCSPRAIDESGHISQAVLERHPFTTQAFIPQGLSTLEWQRRAFVVIVAPHRTSSTSESTRDSKSDPSTFGPDLGLARAFLARGDQGVTYGVGTWHAPMIVVGESPIDFVVVQFVNGVARDDCVEWWFEDHQEEPVKVFMSGWDRRGTRERL